MACKICDKIKKESKLKIYEDEKVIAFIKEKPSALGQITLVSKEHFPILEQVPDFIVDHLLVIANKLSSALFDSLNIQGTNILINNGVTAGQKHSHFSINIIPRTENDNINLEWKPKQLDEEEMSTVELKLKEHTAHIGAFEKEKKQESIPETKKEVIQDEENYLVKQLRRIP